MLLQKKIIRRINKTNTAHIPIKDTDIVSVSLLPTLNNIRPGYMFKIQKYSIYTKI